MQVAYLNKSGGSKGRQSPPNSSGDTNKNCFLFGQRQRGGVASFRSADAAQVCSNVGFVAVDGKVERSAAIAARQIVSERW